MNESKAQSLRQYERRERIHRSWVYVCVHMRISPNDKWSAPTYNILLLSTGIQLVSFFLFSRTLSLSLSVYLLLAPSPLVSICVTHWWYMGHWGSFFALYSFTHSPTRWYMVVWTKRSRLNNVCTRTFTPARRTNRIERRGESEASLLESRSRETYHRLSHIHMWWIHRQNQLQ